MTAKSDGARSAVATVLWDLEFGCSGRRAFPVVFGNVPCAS